MITRKTLTLSTALLALALPAMAQVNVPGAHFIENWDFSGDGKVSLEEATERRDDIFTTFDADEDGVLSGEEYDAFDAARAADMEQMQEELGQGMAPGQRPGQGKGIGQGQGKGMGQGRGHGGGMGGYASSMDRSVSDLDGDGVTTREEFVGNSAAWFAMRDRDSDGFITTADFGPGH